MSTIDPSSPLLAQLRAEALAWRRKGAARDDLGGLEQPAKGGGAERGDWLAQVARAVVAIDREDPDRRRKAFRIYLQAALARECGIQQVDDPAFQDLVERVRDTMESDDRLRPAIRSAGDLLLRTAGG